MNPMVKYLHKFSEASYIVLRAAAAFLMAGMLILMVTEVVRRYIFSLTWPWSEEIIKCAIIYCAYLGGAAAYYKRGMVSFDLVTNKLTQSVKDVLNLVINVILTVFFSFMIYLTFMKMTSRAVVKSISTASGMSAAVPYFGIFIGLCFLAIFTIDFYPDLVCHVFSKSKGKGGKR